MIVMAFCIDASPMKRVSSIIVIETLPPHLTSHNHIPQTSRRASLVGIDHLSPQQLLGRVNVPKGLPAQAPAHSKFLFWASIHKDKDSCRSQTTLNPSYSFIMKIHPPQHLTQKAHPTVSYAFSKSILKIIACFFLHFASWITLFSTTILSNILLPAKKADCSSPMTLRRTNLSLCQNLCYDFIYVPNERDSKLIKKINF